MWRKAYPWLCGTVAVLAVLSLGILAYEQSVPGGSSLERVLIMLMMLAVAAVLYGIALIIAIRQKRVNKTFVAAHVLALGLLGFALSDLPQKIHWSFMRPTLDQAVAERMCPQRAGIETVEKCGIVSGQPSFHFGGGFIDHNEVVKTSDPSTLDERYKVQKKLSDDWYEVAVSF